MRKILIFLFLIISLSVRATTYYVTTSGSNSNNGTSIGTAWATWQYGMTHLVAGDVLYIRAGTYTTMYSTEVGVYIKQTSGRGNNGTSGSHITVSVYPGDASPVLDCGNLTESGREHDGFVIENTYYWDIIGLTVTNCKNRNASDQPAPGLVLQSSGNITLNQCVLYNNDNGFISYSTDYAYFINCDSHANGLLNLYRGNNGFYADAAGGAHVFFDGCRSWGNGQDGWDCFNFQGQASGYISYNRCWSFNNCQYQAGAGFKTGVTSAPAIGSAPQRILTNCISAYNNGGYDESQDYGSDQSPVWHGYSIPTVIYNCISYHNGTGYEYSAGAPFGTFYTDYIRNCLSYFDGSVNPNTGLWEEHITWNNNGPSGFGSNVESNNSWDIRTMVESDFANLEISQLSAARQADGSLPIITAFHLSSSATDFIGSGYNLGSPYDYDGAGVAWAGTYDRGAFKYGGVPDIVAPTVTTTAITGITASSASSGGNVTSSGGATVTARGICWSTSASPTTNDSKTSDGSGTGSYTSSITGLPASTLYYVRAYATNSAGTGYGSNVSFTTSSGTTVPSVTTNAVTSILATSATGGGNVTSDGGASLTALGVCWNTSTNPTTSNGHTTDGTSIGTFASSITGLTSSTLYYVRAYATNSVGTTYGSNVTFTTLASIVSVTSITVTGTGGATTITTNGGTLQMIESVLPANATNKNVTWSVTNGTGSASISGSGLLTALTNGSVTVRATAQDGSAVYGTLAITISNQLPPTLQTGLVSHYSLEEATGTMYDSKSTNHFNYIYGTPTYNVTGKLGYGVDFASAGDGANLMTSAFNLSSAATLSLWVKFNQLPTTSGHAQYIFRNTHTGSPWYSFSLSLESNNTWLFSVNDVSGQVYNVVYSAPTTGVWYHVVCVASQGSALRLYINNVKTSSGGVLVNNLISTDEQSCIGNAYEASTYGAMAVIDELDWSNRAFTDSDVALLYNNGNGLVYPYTLGSVTTTTVTGVTVSTATSGGNVISEGGAPVTLRGVCWSTSANPTTAGLHTTDGSGSGVFASSITGLTAGTTYHVRAYAFNSEGTAYGADIQFTSSVVTTTTPVIHNGHPVTQGGKLLIIIR